MRLSILIAAVVAALAAPVRDPAVPPNGSLAVAYRQVNEGRPSEAVHQIELQCWDGNCSLTTLTLNQCLDSSEGLAFVPKVERSSTEDGDLKVLRVSSGLLEVEQELGGARLLYRFSFTERSDPDLARQTGLRSSRFFKGLSSFSGAATKNSTILGKVISWTMEPLKGQFAFVQAKCKMMLAGVPE